MKKSIILLMVVAISITFPFCSKEKNPAPPAAAETTLKINVVSSNGTPVSNASVALYSTSSDWDNQVNAVGVKTSDGSGVVIFTGLSSLKYYFFAQQDCFNNGYNSISTAGPIQLNNTTTATATIGQSGSLIFKNTSVNPYKIFINGTSYFDVQGNSVKTVKYKPSGPYILRVLQLSGYVLTPTDRTYNGTLLCGGTLTTTFP